MSWSRREFLIGCSAAIAAMSAGRIGQLAFAAPGQPQATNEIFVQVFLRGGCDGLSLLSPYDDGVYRGARGSLALPTSGANAALRIEPQNDSYATSSFGLNSQMPQLRELYNGGQLALVHACGLDDDTRSHFDAMDYMERGTPGDKTTGSGWITRHLLAQGGLGGLLPAVAAGGAPPAALLGYSPTVAMSAPSEFSLSTGWRYNRPEENYQMLSALQAMYGGSALATLAPAGQRVLATIGALRGVASYTPAPGVSYPDDSFGSALRTVAQLVKLDQGLRVATVDFGGWDTHESQASGDGSGYLPTRLGALSRGLYAFYSDLAAFHGRLTIVVMSEFGRRLGRNASNGTDHGHGNVMMVLGGNVNGGRVYGQWPGLVNLDKGQDLRITTDYRLVLSEILLRRLGNPQLGAIFPGLAPAAYTPLGIVRGADLAPSWSAPAGLAAPGEGEHRVFLPTLQRC